MTLLTSQDTAVFAGIRRLISSDANAATYPDTFFVSDSSRHPDVAFVELSVETRLPGASDLTGDDRERLLLALQYEIAAAILESHKEPIQEAYFSESARYSEHQGERQIAVYRANAENLLAALETAAAPESTHGVYPDTASMLSHLGRLPSLKSADAGVLSLYLDQALAAYTELSPATEDIADVTVPTDRRYTLPAAATGVVSVKVADSEPPGLPVVFTLERSSGLILVIGSIEEPSWASLVVEPVSYYDTPYARGAYSGYCHAPSKVDIRYVRAVLISDLDTTGQLAVQCYVEARWYEESSVVPEQAVNVARTDMSGTTNKLATFRMKLAEQKMKAFKRYASRPYGFRSQTPTEARVPWYPTDVRA